ncbi:hypothetical protein [Roseimaritima ulvae]|uniref:Uncharacterized protein n=1 Tax=Roseimaritima ulvae TaxID=980254 RepID=A0A5B9QJG4_9BACT|nr:hypothetical protein [Roseimaritima ulvae]QEG39054.1 hypothetical protein UC8_10150 [Roseimaritima ulvae]
MNYQWFVCEPESRWLRLSRRFAPQMLPSSDDGLSITPLDAARLAARLNSPRPTVALWSLETAPQCDQILPQLRGLFAPSAASRHLHFVAVDPRLEQDARLALSAWGVLILDRPEQLAQYAALVTRFWQTAQPVAGGRGVGE